MLDQKKIKELPVVGDVIVELTMKYQVSDTATNLHVIKWRVWNN